MFTTTITYGHNLFITSVTETNYIKFYNRCDHIKLDLCGHPVYTSMHCAWLDMDVTYGHCLFKTFATGTNFTNILCQHDMTVVF